MKKICVVTSTRAEYGILKPLIKKLRMYSGWEVQLVVTGAHLVERLGNTSQEVEEDGIEIYDRIPINTEGDTDYDVSLIMANALVRFGKFFRDENPNLLVVLGDRTEIFAICAAAVNAHIPIAHIHGGELTFGLVDDCMRHAITKMSYLHFASAEEYRNRIIQMGEEPERVFNVGALGVENIIKEELMEQETLGIDVGFPSEQAYAVVTFHPVTLDIGQAEIQIKELFLAMQGRKDLFFLITKANADAGGDTINRFIERESMKSSNMKLVSSLGMKRYLSAVKYARFVLGNSSSGIIEAPSLGVPTVNIGDRQKGRIMAESIISCEPEHQCILDAIEIAMRMKQGKYVSPYGDGTASEQIIKVVKEFLLEGRMDLKKKFYDICWRGRKEV